MYVSCKKKEIGTDLYSKKMQVNGGHHAKATVVRVVVAGGCSKYVIIVFPVLDFILGDLISQRLLTRLMASRVA